MVGLVYRMMRRFRKIAARDIALVSALVLAGVARAETPDLANGRWETEKAPFGQLKVIDIVRQGERFTIIPVQPNGGCGEAYATLAATGAGYFDYVRPLELIEFEKRPGAMQRLVGITAASKATKGKHLEVHADVRADAMLLSVESGSYRPESRVLPRMFRLYRKTGPAQCTAPAVS